MRARRAELRVTQRESAAAANLSAAHLSELEHDRHRVAESTLRRLAAVLALDPADLLAHARREHRLADRPSATGDRSPRVTTPLPVAVDQRPSPDTQAPWITAREAAAIPGVTPHAVNALIRRGMLAPAIRRPGVASKPP